jgi:hypothetical protein
MPGASEEGRGGSDAAFSLEGSYESFATRMLVSQDDEDTVLSWHRAAYEALGWAPVDYPYIAMQKAGFRRTRGGAASWSSDSAFRIAGDCKSRIPAGRSTRSRSPIGRRPRQVLELHLRQVTFPHSR